MPDHLGTHDNTRLCDLNIYLAKDSNIIAQDLISTLEEICAMKVTGFGATQAKASCWLIWRDVHWYLAIIYLFIREGSGLGVLGDKLLKTANPLTINMSLRINGQAFVAERAALAQSLPHATGKLVVLVLACA